ncbi:Usher syndrome type-1G protein-like protein [Operophtera brumata]|uniref:Usher syndrome type-1G protein-like protein n=1 Tax=Operophtera brumata TaxID=104452 RepID=A0A0L7L369_OPEBR|nr:Usher syndrome type-1G protein-like protein [Operophtera brumata]
MTTDRFHKAAKDGLLEVLREATRKECNNKDESGMTPTLWAAFEGHIEALRLLCGRGGEPDKADYFGNTALHLAAARGHKECVTFLINFGANVFAMDVDGHSAQELAAINGRDDILRYLDQATAKLENNDKKKTKSLKEKAKKDYEKSHKQYQKRQSKAEVLAEKELKKLTKEWEQGYAEEVSTMPHRPSNVLLALKQKMTRALVGTVSAGARGRGAVYKKALASKLRNNTVGETETSGRRSVTSLSGVRRDSEVMYVGTFGAGAQARGNVADVSASQPDFQAAAGEDSGIGQEVMLQEPASIFDRPGFGSVAFRWVSTSSHQLAISSQPDFQAAAGEDSGIGQEPASIFDRPGFGSVAFRWVSTSSHQLAISSQPDFQAAVGEDSGVGQEPASIFGRPGFGSVAFRWVSTSSHQLAISSQPDFQAAAGEDSGIGQEPASIFDRPGFGSVAFRWVSTSSHQLAISSQPDFQAAAGEDSGIPSGGRRGQRHRAGASQHLRQARLRERGVQVKRNDTFTFQLCKECYFNMKQSCKFKKQCRTSDKHFKNYLLLKEDGDDFGTFIKNMDENLALRLPMASGTTSTPAYQKNKDDDNGNVLTYFTIYPDCTKWLQKISG